MKKMKIPPTTAVVPCPAVLLSVGEGPKANIITLSWVANDCSKPPTVVVGVRPERYSYVILKEQQDFVINIPTTDQFQATVLCGTKSGRDINKFEATGLTAIPSSDKISSYLIEECPINIECKKTQLLELGFHHLFFGEVVNVNIDDNILNNQGRLDVSKAKLFTYNPIAGEYWTLGSKLDPKKD